MCSLYTFSYSSEDMVPVYEDSIQVAEENDVGPGFQAVDCQAKVDQGKLQFPVSPPVHLGRPQPARQCADHSAPGGSGGGGMREEMMKMRL